MKRIISSPLKIAGLITTVLGLFGVLTFSYFSFVGIYLVGIGLLIFIIDYVTLKLLKNKKYWISQAILTASYIVLILVTYMKWQEHNYIIFPHGYKGQSGIIFGIDGYPELPNTVFWKKTIQIPVNGIIVTSTKVEDIPNKIHFAFSDNSEVDYQSISWDANFEIDCIVSDSKIRSWLFQIGEKENVEVQEFMISLCNEIADNKKISHYKSEISAVQSDNNGLYLNLLGKGLTALPNGLEKLNVYRVILTGNDFREIPEQVFEINILEDLIMAVNPIKEFPCNLSRLKRLKSISFAETQIKEINCDLSELDSLEHFDIARNSLTKVPEKINTIPNLTWLSLNDNQLTDLSFIDNRLSKLETLYLYSNKVKIFSKEIKYLRNLKELLIFDNEIDSIPNNIADLKNLEKLEIWDNPIKYISPKIAELTNLKSIRLDDDYLSQTDKNNLKKWLPNCEIYYQTRSEKKNIS